MKCIRCNNDITHGKLCPFCADVVLRESGVLGELMNDYKPDKTTTNGFLPRG